MKFWEAMKALEEGKKIRRRCDPPDFYVTVGHKKNLVLHTADKDYDKTNCPLNRVFIEEWEPYEQPEKTYTFMEVVKGLKEGKKYKRIGWDNPIYVQGSAIFVRCQWLPCVFNLEDFEATDWVEVK